METYQAKLDSIVRDFENGRLNFRDFQAAYSACYADENADAEFTPSEVEYYGAIHERAEWTTAAPTPEESGYGWLNEDGFRAWLTEHTRRRPPMGN